MWPITDKLSKGAQSEVHLSNWNYSLVVVVSYSQVFLFLISSEIKIVCFLKELVPSHPLEQMAHNVEAAFWHASFGLVKQSSPFVDQCFGEGLTQ